MLSREEKLRRYARIGLLKTAGGTNV